VNVEVVIRRRVLDVDTDTIRHCRKVPAQRNDGVIGEKNDLTNGGPYKYV
jgi:hypothetical protein